MSKVDTWKENPHLVGPFYPGHPEGHAPRWHPGAKSISGKCPECGSSLVGALGWAWCFNHDHPWEEFMGERPIPGDIDYVEEPQDNVGVWYTCAYERKL